MAGRQWVKEMLRDFVFSFSQGAAAAAKTPGARGGMASLAASLQAPQLRQDLLRQREMEDEERQQKMEALRRAAILGDQQQIKNAIDIFANTEGPQMTVPRPTTQQAPIGDSLTDPGSMSMGPRPAPVGMRSLATASPAPLQIGGQSVQPSFGNQIRDRAMQEKMALDEATTQNDIAKALATRVPAAPPAGFALSPGQTRFDASGNPIVSLPPAAAKDDDVTLTPDRVSVDGKGAEVLRDKKGNYFDVNTKQPITGRITPYVAPPTPRARGEITPTAEAGLIQQLNKQWDAASKDVQALYRANTIMDAGMQAARKGDLNAGSQAVLITFQKFLDPTSVVRESEYARSAEGLSVANRVRGFVDRMASGGAGVTLPELETFAALARQINTRLTAEGNSLLSAEKKRIESIASRYNIPPEMVIPKYDYAQPGGSGTPATGQPKTMILNGKTLTLGPDGKYH